MTPDEAPTMAELGWRLRTLEAKVDKVETHTAEGFASLSTQLANLGFVRSDVYASDQRAVADKVENAHRLAMWAVGLTASTTIGAIITGILTVSGAFR